MIDTFMMLQEPVQGAGKNLNHRFWLLDTEGNMQQMKGAEIVNLSAEDSLAIHQVCKQA